MIESFRHKGLRQLFEHDRRAKLPPDAVERIRTILSFLDAAASVEEMDRPSFRLHPLKGDMKVLGGYCPRKLADIFRFQDGNVSDVDFLDFH